MKYAFMRLNIFLALPFFGTGSPLPMYKEVWELAWMKRLVTLRIREQQELSHSRSKDIKLGLRCDSEGGVRGNWQRPATLCLTRDGVSCS